MTTLDADNLQPIDGPVLFAVLGDLPMNEPVDPEFDFQTHQDTHWTARKACSMLKVVASLVSATVVYPGADADEHALVSATRELMSRAARLTDSAVELLGLPASDPNLAAYKNLLRQQAAEVVSTQWRLVNGAGMKELSVDQISSMYRLVLENESIDKEGDLPSCPEDVDEVTAKRLALLAVVPTIYQAVGCFDYFVPNPETLVERGVGKVIAAADSGVSRMASPDTRPDTRAMITQSIIGKAGMLYGVNFRAHARRDVLMLRQMDPAARARHLYLHRETGLSTDHVDESFDKLMKRMVDMVCESVPELDRVATMSTTISTKNIASSAPHQDRPRMIHEPHPE